jgi:DNA-binding transcriptional ArsR family regulator
MDVEPSIAALGALIGTPARATILSALFDGRALTATELAMAAGITPQTASSHLNKLSEAQLIVAERHGKFRYYKLAGPHVAEALEPLTLLSPHKPVPHRARSKSDAEAREARFCYDHIAGRLGVAVTSAMVAMGCLKEIGRDYVITDTGRAFLEKLEIDVDAIGTQRRVLARKCLDWSERKPHVSGSLGAALAATFTAKGWLKRAKYGRQAIISEQGKRAMKKLFFIEC